MSSSKPPGLPQSSISDISFQIPHDSSLPALSEKCMRLQQEIRKFRALKEEALKENDSIRRHIQTQAQSAERDISSLQTGHKQENKRISVALKLLAGQIDTLESEISFVDEANRVASEAIRSSDREHSARKTKLELAIKDASRRREQLVDQLSQLHGSSAARASAMQALRVEQAGLEAETVTAAAGLTKLSGIHVMLVEGQEEPLGLVESLQAELSAAESTVRDLTKSLEDDPVSFSADGPGELEKALATLRLRRSQTAELMRMCSVISSSSLSTR
eukprot:gnl/Dysnectes_brevis/6162_a9335_336.p1 GENE.gnl/Dysnectes_brevis/6162_a9335_336~~gnl/Dysnectes_brevis/6162_a9335_336.p1  ORF type:complete len:276 (+),score=59.37 gnl/Dysnectes_brevis/6162_a9335_336:606-1433(+)